MDPETPGRAALVPVLGRICFTEHAAAKGPGVSLLPLGLVDELEIVGKFDER